MKTSKIIICLLIAFTAACSKNTGDENSKIKRLAFNENPVLLGEELVLKDLNMSLKIPAGFKKLSDAEIERVKDQISGEKLENYSSEIERIYLSEKNNIIFSISAVKNNSFTSYMELVEYLNANYLTSLKSRRTVEFFKDQYYMAQFMCYDDKNLILKTFIKNSSGSDIEMNFLMPSVEYNDFSRSIESVIASVKKTK